MLNPDFHDILSEFNEKRVDYLLVGAYAVAAHGLPRATGDIDLWIRTTPGNVASTRLALASFGAPLELLDARDLELPDRVVQLGVSPRRIDLLTSIDGVEFDAAWNARVVIRVDDIEVPVISLEHLIANKRAVGRPQDIADADRLTKLHG